MAQHDYVIDNQNGASFRSDLNSALSAAASANAGASAPTTTYAYMLWADSTTGILKQRNGSNTAWISIGYINNEPFRVVMSATDTILGRTSAGSGAAQEITCTAFARTLLDDASAATARTTLSAQAQAATLTSISSLGTAADVLLYTTGAATFAETSISSLGRSFLLATEPTSARAAIAAVATPVAEGDLASSAVSQSKLKATYGEASTTTAGHITLPGGSYGFWPRTRVASSSGGSPQCNMTLMSALSPITAYAAQIYMSPTNCSGLAEQYYIQACKPYDLGDGNVELFVFMLVDKAKKILATWVAPEGPWHLNGPTDTRAEWYSEDGQRGFRWTNPIIAEFGSVDNALKAGLSRKEIVKTLASGEQVKMEITQAIKQADMALIPHPFGTVPKDCTVVMLDPVSEIMGELLVYHNNGSDLDRVSELLRYERVVFGNERINRHAPPGVMPVAVRFK